MPAHARWSALAAVLLVAAMPEAVQAQGPGAAGGSTAPLESREHAALLAIREQVWRAWFANDQARLRVLLPQEVIAINNGDTTWYDRAGVLAGARDFARSGARLIGVAFPRTEVQAFGDVAVLYSLYRVETEADGKRTVDSGRATEVFVRRDGSWVNPSWHLDSGR